MDNKQFNYFIKDVFPFYESLNDAEKKLITQNHKFLKFTKGSSIHNGNEKCTGVIAIAKGTLRVYLFSDEGKEITLFRLKQNDVCLLSASCIFNNITFDIYVEAESDCEVMLINPKAYDQLSSNNLAVSTFVNETISSRFSDVMWVIEQIVFMKMDKRLAIFLTEESSMDQSNVLTLTHDTIAKHMGTAREVVSRMLKYFENENIVSLSRKGITILDKNKLRSLTM